MMDKANIQLQHYVDATNVTWYWTDGTGKTISPYIGDSDVAERWANSIYKQSTTEWLLLTDKCITQTNR
jgi:hypothetical protein